MTLDPDRALQKAVIAALRGAASLTALLGAPPRVYDEPPAHPIYPYVTLSRSEIRPRAGWRARGSNMPSVSPVSPASEGWKRPRR